MIKTEKNSNFKSRPVLKCNNPYKPFHESNCLVTVSVGQEVHEGDKFEATIDLINRSFKSCTICIDDSLQRHSIAIEKGSTPDALYEYSVQLGDSWYERNKHIIEKLDIPFEVVRWDKWLRHENYDYIYSRVRNFYSVDPGCKQALATTISAFLRRFLDRIPEHRRPSYSEGYGLCENYLLEECAALCLWQQEGYDYELYPSKRSAALDYVHKQLVDPFDTGRLTSIYIKFKNRKQLKPQVLESMCQILN